MPVLDETAHVDRPGGAGLAAVFAAAQGAEVALVTALADDAGGARLGTLLAAAGVQVYRPGAAPARTPEKVRLRARGRVLLRHDRGGAAGTPGEPSDAALRVIARRLRRAGQRLRPGRGPAARAAGRAGRHPGAGGLGPASARTGGGARGAPGDPERVRGAGAGHGRAGRDPAGDRGARRPGAAPALAAPARSR